MLRGMSVSGCVPESAFNCLEALLRRELVPFMSGILGLGKSELLVPEAYQKKSMVAVLTGKALPIILSASLVVGACDGPPVTPEPPVVPPNPDCIVGSAVEHASSLGLNIDVGIYDNNKDSRGGCFTIHEKNMIDGLYNVRKVFGIEELVLQEIVDVYRTVGPLTVSALRDHAIGWDYDQKYFSAPFFSGRLNYILAHRMVPTMLMPGLQANPDVSGFEVGHFYPINEGVYHWIPPRMNNLEDVDMVPSETFLSRMGYDECRRAIPQQFVGSLDIGTPDHSVNRVYLGWPEPVKLINLIPTTRTRGGITYNEFGLGFLYKVDPDDKYLLNVEEVFIGVSHMFPKEFASLKTREDYLLMYGFKIGGEVQPYTFLGYNDNIGKYVDISYETTNFIYGAPRNVTNNYVFDLLGAHFSNNPDNLGIRFAESRFDNLRIHAPCSTDDLGNWINLP